MSELSPPCEVYALMYNAEYWGISPDDFERILRHALTIVDANLPAALSDLRCQYRVLAVMTEGRRHVSGETLGTYLGRTIVLWPKDGGRQVMYCAQLAKAEAAEAMRAGGVGGAWA